MLDDPSLKGLEVIFQWFSVITMRSVPRLERMSCGLSYTLLTPTPTQGYTWLPTLLCYFLSLYFAIMAIRMLAE